MGSPRLVGLVLVAALIAGACSAASPMLVDSELAEAPTPDTSTSNRGRDRAPEARTSTVGDVDDGPSAPPAALLEVEVITRLGHDPTAWTQGLLFDGDRLFESRGLYGESALTEIDPETGVTVRRVDLDGDYFAEGLALVDGRLIQLTWQAGRAFVYDADSFDVIDEFRYDGEGWGLCWDGADLWMSDGTATLERRDPDTFEVRSAVVVTLGGAPLGDLNELECFDGLVWANVWLTDLIVAIDPQSGVVVSQVDASGLLTDEERSADDVLNGIAYDPVRDVVLLTGKNWPAMFEVEFTDCAGDC